MNKIPLKRALLWIALSVVLVSGSTSLAIFYLKYVKNFYATDATYNIIAIVQSSADREMLQTVYLAELLGLSLDQPKNLYTFSTKEAEKKLLSNPLIKKVSVKKIRPGTLFIEYEMRKPLAFLSNYSNTVLDAEGYTFPFKPFFTPKKLPEIIFSTDAEIAPTWGIQIQGREMELAHTLLKKIQKECERTHSSILRIDVSKAFASSCGQRQVVLVLEEHRNVEQQKESSFRTSTSILRLNPTTWCQGLENYTRLSTLLKKKGVANKNSQESHTEFPRVVDLRLLQLAFISEKI
jgi:hypothetical protein